jgi:hypothetical protein
LPGEARGYQVAFQSDRPEREAPAGRPADHRVREVAGAGADVEQAEPGPALDTLEQPRDTPRGGGLAPEPAVGAPDVVE